MKLTYKMHMGSDLSVVDAARVSFGKESIEAYHRHSCIDGQDLLVPVVSAVDEKLINYLAAHNHWSPFAHTSIQFHFKAPIFVARQLVKHQVGMTWNEISRRYVKTSPELWWPSKWRKAAQNVKQGSSDEEFSGFGECNYSPRFLAERILEEYNTLVRLGLCPEQARMFLPQNTYTEWVWTGSLYAWARVFNQRTDPHAQKETRDLIQQLDERCAALFPVSWKELTT